jgi:predicted RND superfamily exporter protein
MISNTPQGLPGSGRLEDFDRQSGQLLERLLFNHRPLILLLCALVTAFLGFEVSRLDLNANFEAMIPVGHPFIRNYLAHQDDLQGQGNTLEIVVEAKHGTILDAHYMDVLQHINDEVFLLPGVNRPYMKSIWTPATRWTTVTPEGFDGGPVIPNDYDGSKHALDELRTNLLRSGEIGQLIAPDFKSSIVLVPLLDINSATGKPLDYGQLSRELEAVRAKYSSPDIAIHITGFAKIMGDLITALHEILLFFALSITISLAMVYWYTRCWRSTALVVACSLIAVTWQLGILPMLGFSLDPYSVLVPFLVFAIGMSHGAQKMNGVMQDIGRGAHRLVAARYTFRRLFVAGFSALMCDAVGFAVLLVIRIEAIQRLALIASIGVAILVFTNLILLPILLSYVGVDSRAAARSLKSETDALQGATKARLWRLLDLFTTPRYAAAAIFGAILLGIFGFWVGQRLQIGDLQRRLRHHGDDAAIPVRQLQGAAGGRSPGMAAARRAGRRGHQLRRRPGAPDDLGSERGQFQMVRDHSESGHARPDGEPRAARALQPGLQFPDPLCLPERPQGGDAQPGGRYGSAIRQCQ